MLDIITIGSEWPGGISDGLILPCAVCHQSVKFDYHVTDECWEAVVPKDKRLGVICLPCLDMLAEQKGIDISQSIEGMQFTGVGKTIVLIPEIAYKWKVKAFHRAAFWRMKWIVTAVMNSWYIVALLVMRSKGLNANGNVLSAGAELPNRITQRYRL